MLGILPAWTVLQDMQAVLDSPALEHSHLRYHPFRQPPSQPGTSDAGASVLAVAVIGDRVQQEGAGGSTFTEYVLEVVGNEGQTWQVAHRFRWAM